MSELKQIIEQPHQVWDDHTSPLSDYDKIQISWLKQGAWVSQSFNRKTLCKLGLCVNSSGIMEEKIDQRHFNGGHSNGGAKQKPEDEKKVSVTIYEDPQIIKNFGGKEQYKIAVRQFTKEHTNL